jgi:hypothetical protein
MAVSRQFLTFSLPGRQVQPEKAQFFGRQTLDETAERKEQILLCSTWAALSSKRQLRGLGPPGYGTLKGKNDYQIRCMDAACGV